MRETLVNLPPTEYDEDEMKKPDPENIMKPPDPIQVDPGKTDPYGTLEVVRRACPEVIQAAHGALSLVNENEPTRLAILDSALEIIGDPVKRSEFDGKQELEKGKSIGNYTITEKIAEGGFGPHPRW